MTKRVITLIFLSILLAILPLMANGPQWKPFINSKKVNCLADYGDYLLIGTSHGGITKLHKRSGEKEYLNTFNGTLRLTSVEDIYLLPDGDMWLKTGYLFKYSDGELKDVTSLFPIERVDEVSAAFIDSFGNLWMAYKYYKDNGNEWAVGVFNKNLAEVYTDENSVLHEYMTVYQFCERPDGTVWFVSLNGIYFYKNGTMTRFTDAPMGFPMDDIRSIACDSEGTLWFGSTSGGIATFNDTSWTIYNTTSGALPSNYVSSFTPHGNEMWVSTASGIAIKDASGWRTITNENSEMPNTFCKKVIIDADGCKWIASGGDVIKYDDEEWSIINASEHKTPFDKWKTKLHIDKSNAITLLDSRGNKATLEDTLWNITKPSPADSQYYAKQRSIIIDENDNPWIGTEDGKIHHYDGTGWKTFEYPKKEQLYSNRDLPPDFGAMDLAFDANGDLWVAADQNKLGHFDGENWTMYDTSNSNGVYIREIVSLAIDTNGHVWTGQHGQIQKFDGENWITYNEESCGHLTADISAMEFDSKGVLWIAADFRGLVRFDGKSWELYNPDDYDLPYMQVDDIVIDKFDNKWLWAYRHGYGSILVQFHESGIKKTNIIETSKASMASKVTLQNRATKSRLTFPMTKEALTLDLFDLKGRVVMQLRQAGTVAGVKQLEIPHGDLSHGLYLYQLKAGSEVYSGKLILEE